MPSTTPSPDAGPRVTRDQMRDISTLRRASDNKMVAGVAEGLSKHFDVDPLLIRVVFFALTFFGGAGLLLYVLAWVTIPKEGKHDSALSSLFRRSPNRVMQVGLVFGAVVAAAAMLSAIGFSAPNPAPLLVLSILAIGAFAVFTRRGDRPTPAAVEAPAVESETDNGPMPSEPTRAWWQRPDDTGPGSSGPPPPSGSSPPPVSPPVSRRQRSHLFGITMAAVAIAMGVVWILDLTVFDDMPASVYPGTALGIVAAALLLGSWYGRSRLLIAAGIIATLATGVAAAAGPGPYGDSVYRPTSVAQLDTTYEHGVGRLVVHLEGLTDPGQLDGRSLKLDSHIGQLKVIVPSTIPVTIHAHVDHGEIAGPARADVAKPDSRGQDIEMSSVPDGGAAALSLDVDLDFGQIAIVQYDCPSTGAAGVGLDTDERIGGTHAAAACD